jgi:hypothetical protein
MNNDKIVINGETYIKESLCIQENTKLDGMEAVIVRTYSAGVFYGYLESQVGQEVVLRKARRMWQWYGASLSECAQSGTPDASKCKFPEAVDTVKLLNSIEILSLTDNAKKTLDAVKIWKA